MKYNKLNINDFNLDNIDALSLQDDEKGFRLFVRDDNTNKVLKIVFEMPLVYLNIDEGDMLTTLALNKDLSLGIFKVDYSMLLAWFYNESLGKYHGREIDHYFIVTQNHCMHVLSQFPPIISETGLSPD